MKKLLYFAALVATTAGCTKKDATHEAVSAYIVKNLGDPSSYQPVRWGPPSSFRQQHADTLAAGPARLKAAKEYALYEAQKDTMEQFARVGAEDFIFNYHKSKFLATAHRVDSLLAIADKLKQSKDSTRLGTTVMHAFRAKNKMGALVLDSAHFVVFKNGKVEQI